MLCFLSIFTLCGCANIEYYRAVDATGIIVDKLVVTLDSQDINSKGLNYMYIRDEVVRDMTKFVNAVESWKSTAFEEYPNVNMAVNENEGIKVRYDETPKENKYSVTVEFANWTMFGLFYGITNMIGGEYQEFMTDVGPFISSIIDDVYTREDLNLFIYKTSKFDCNSIVSEIKELELPNLDNVYNKYTNMTKLDIDDIEISQSFVYPDDRIYSNADVVEVLGGSTFLNWNLSNKDENFQMSIYKIVPKGISWYVLALIISAIVIIVLICIFRFKSSGKDEQKITRREVESNGKK